MLVRAARGHRPPDRSRGFKVACKQLQLPWLCPAYTRSRLSSSRPFTVEAGSPGSSLRKRRNSQDGTSLAARRSLATAVDLRTFSNDIPFENVSHHHLPPGLLPRDHGATSAIPELGSFDPTRTVILKDSGPPPPRIRYYKGIGGDLHDILSILDACLRVGRIERARVIMQRISTLKVLGSDALMGLHNQYLKASVENIIERPSDAAAQELHKWFELEIKNKALPITAETVAHMLRASLQSPPGSRRDRLVRRYMDMGGLEVLGLMEAEEQAYITKIVPDYNYPVGEPDLSQDVVASEQSYSATTETKGRTAIEANPVPTVRPTDIKGLGLKTLQQALSLFSSKPSNFDAGVLDSDQQRQRQTQLEIDSVRAAVDRWREENAKLAKKGVDTVLETKSLGSRMWKWQGVLEAYIQDELVKVEVAESKTSLRSQSDNDRCLYGPFLRILSPARLASVTILAVMGSITAHGASKGLGLAHGITAIGSSIEDECCAEAILKKHGKDALRKLESGQRGNLARMLKRKRHQELVNLTNELTDDSDPNASGKLASRLEPQWSPSIKGRVGAFMMSALIESAKIPVKKIHPETNEEMTQMQPAFSHAYQYRAGKKVGVILGNPALITQLLREPVHSLLAKHLPMLAEPEPWSEFSNGGFIVHPSKMMRIKQGDKDQRLYAEAAIFKGDMEQMFKGLNVLGKTSWKINQPVFDVMLEAWNSGVAIANFPPADPVLETPPEPQASQDYSSRRQWISAVKNVENLRGSYHSQRCFQNFQLEIARALRDETFYFPHNVDFRGRAYPLPPYLNHMGADHCRGLLKFGIGKALGLNGLKWLKIHLANVYGYDKASLDEREKFCADHLTDIYDSAINPLGGSRWWLRAEDPWQCLAACFELKSALDSSNPAQFISHLPIHQDGTCNGLQHYAALGGDEWGAKQVNLTPGDRPADVYSAVAELVKQSVARDLENGNEYAKVLGGKITRKVVKQTVMTNVYGVTFVGAKTQVRKQLEAAYQDLPNTPTMHPGFLSSYIATKIFKVLSSMFGGAHDIQYWLGECASRISQVVAPEQIDLVLKHLSTVDTTQKKSERKKNATFSIEEHLQFKSSVIWTNPLRMPVVQPYRLSESRHIITTLQTVNISDPHRSDPVSKRKQLQGFPPNFIHSLDATHMILSALACDERGLSFAAVHDSFWTHATDVDEMNGVLRDAFIRIHSEDVIGRLAAEFEARYRGSMYLARIKPKSRLGKRLKEFRKNLRYSPGTKPFNDALKGITPTKTVQFRELLIERQRIQLLNSPDPKDVEKGRAMVTAGSIYEEMADEDDLAPPEHLNTLGLGEIPQSASRSPEGEPQQCDMSKIDDIHNPLPMNTPADTTMSSSDVDVSESSSKVEESDPLSERILGTKTKASGNLQWAWVPFKIPPVPKKGFFDVSQLKNSDYFFS